MSDDDKFKLINNVWKPPPNYEFPLTNKRKFSYEWLRLYPSLCYSRYLDGAFCLSCVLFGRWAVHKSTLKNLFTAPFNVWNSARGKLDLHFGVLPNINLLHSKKPQISKSGLHKAASAIFTHFMTVMSGRQLAINIQSGAYKNETTRDNRERLKSIVEYIIFLGRNNLAFRGHKDAGEQSMDSVGLFQNLLNFRVSRGDDVLKRHLQTCPKNSRYTSAPVQNELIEACGTVLTIELFAK